MCVCNIIMTFIAAYSDQTDPFNRAPLTPDMLMVDTELKDKIQQWKIEQTKRRLWTFIKVWHYRLYTSMSNNY